MAELPLYAVCTAVLPSTPPGVDASVELRGFLDEAGGVLAALSLVLRLRPRRMQRALALPPYLLPQLAASVLLAAPAGGILMRRRSATDGQQQAMR